MIILEGSIPQKLDSSFQQLSMQSNGQTLSEDTSYKHSIRKAWQRWEEMKQGKIQPRASKRYTSTSSKSPSVLNVAALTALETPAA
ncbi:hypothetical protein CEXT_664091 [Caerostris extrusa]|uniref:Uncharacterized protein n=1 Tax=Caerostris extrusa TaxID=172846 RepID=A0AAV4XX98_CAEEX|nr:hypothetical protein CEXT_664091 [Caerostris extrusa]